MKNYTEKRSTLIKVPSTKTVSTSLNIAAPAKNAWDIVGKFSNFHNFIDGLSNTEMVGEGVRSVRKKLFQDGNVVIEQLNEIDQKNMSMSWSLIYTSLDINNLWSSMRVELINEGECKVIWDIAGEPYSPDTKLPDFEAFLSSFALGALTNVKSILEKEKQAA